MLLCFVNRHSHDLSFAFHSNIIPYSLLLMRLLVFRLSFACFCAVCSGDLVVIGRRWQRNLHLCGHTGSPSEIIFGFVFNHTVFFISCGASEDLTKFSAESLFVHLLTLVTTPHMLPGRSTRAARSPKERRQALRFAAAACCSRGRRIRQYGLRGYGVTVVGNGGR